MNNSFDTTVLQEILSDDNNKSYNSYVCNNCHMSFFDKNERTICLVCGGTLDKVDKKLENENCSYVPFDISLENAIKSYKKHVMFNPLIPIIFKTKKTIQRIESVYIPAFLLDININGDVTFKAGDKVDKKGKNIKKYNFKGYNNFDYKNIFLCQWSKLNDSLFKNSFKYDYQKLQEIDFSKVEGTFVGSDLNSNDEISAINTKVMNKSLSVIRSNVPHELTKVTDNQLQATVINNRFIYVPAYFLNVSYKGKDYQYIFNGQNGNDKFKLTFGLIELIVFSLLSFIFIFVIGFLIAKFL